MSTNYAFALDTFRQRAEKSGVGTSGLRGCLVAASQLRLLLCCAIRVSAKGNAPFPRLEVRLG